MYFVDVLIPKSMLLTITLIITALVAVNFLLLIFSSNKINKPKIISKKPVILKPIIPLKQERKSLAPTGS